MSDKSYDHRIAMAKLLDRHDAIQYILIPQLTEKVNQASSRGVILSTSDTIILLDILKTLHSLITEQD